MPKSTHLYKAKHIHTMSCNDHLSGTWVQGYLCAENYINTGEAEMLIDPSTICRCTGKKADTLIFENDILRETADYDEVGNPLHYIYEVCWDNEDCRFVGREIFSGEIISMSELGDCEVIGNYIDIVDSIKAGLTFDERIFKVADEKGYLLDGRFEFNGKEYPVYIQSNSALDYETQAARKIFGILSDTNPKELVDYIHKLHQKDLLMNFVVNDEVGTNVTIDETEELFPDIPHFLR